MFGDYYPVLGVSLYHSTKEKKYLLTSFSLAIYWYIISTISSLFALSFSFLRLNGVGKLGVLEGNPPMEPYFLKLVALYINRVLLQS